jgi:hypothetical protein
VRSMSQAVKLNLQCMLCPKRQEVKPSCARICTQPRLEVRPNPLPGLSHKVMPVRGSQYACTLSSWEMGHFSSVANG